MSHLWNGPIDWPQGGLLWQVPDHPVSAARGDTYRRTGREGAAAPADGNRIDAGGHAAI